MGSLGESQPGVLRMTRDSIENIWGERTPYKHEWPTTVDEKVLEELDKWVQSACFLCKYDGLQRSTVYTKYLDLQHDIAMAAK